MSHDTAASGETQRHHVPLGPRQHVFIGVFLTVVTIVELWLSYSGLNRALMVTLLIVLSAVKFGTVVAFFMHLRFDNPVLTRLFVFGFVLASAILLALISLFWFDHFINRQVG
jgi:cytochrome c oxidase subunit IV